MIEPNYNIKKWESIIYLEPIEHVYIHKTTSMRYKSVTTVLGMVEPHFDSEGVSEAIVRQSDEKKNPIYLGMNKDQILDYWQELNDRANEYGSHVHDTIEYYLLSNKTWVPDDELQRKAIAGYESLGLNEGQTMWPERIMFAEAYNLAGMSDLIIDLDNEHFQVVDWKTNKEFNFVNKYRYETLHKPFDHLQNCQYSIYTLQLSVYAYMYELEFPNKKCVSITIGYWDKVAETMVKIPIMYLKTEAKKLLELYKYKTML
jgi:hypothetical protein